MNRMNLKELRDALNKLPEENLDRYAFSHDLGVEDGSGEFAMLFMGDEDEINMLGIYETKEYEDIKERFLKYLNKDVIELAKAKIDEDYIEEVADDWEPDW